MFETTKIKTKGIQGHLADGGRKRFLIVEDDFLAQPVWEQVIRAVAPTAIIRWATTGEDAEKIINEGLTLGEHFDCVVSDIFLAGKKTGVDLCHHFRHLPVRFLLTSSIGLIQFAEMIEPHQNLQACLLQKPFGIKDGVACLGTILL